MSGRARIHPEFRGYGSASHGVCFTCRMARRKDEVVVDMGFDVFDPESHATGALQVCSGCLKHLARLVGMVDDTQVVSAKAAVEKLSALLDDESERANAATAALSALVTFKQSK